TRAVGRRIPDGLQYQQGRRSDGVSRPPSPHRRPPTLLATRLVNLVGRLPSKRQTMWLDLPINDLRMAWRNAVRRPGFTLLVTLTLALGLGVNAAVFALVDAVLLRPLPFRDPSRLVFVWQTLPKLSATGTFEATPFDYDTWRALRVFSEFGMLQYGSFSLTGDADTPAERVRGSRSTASLMPLLGIQPAVGRAFTPDEDSDASAAVAILGDSLWRRRYGADPSIVGRTIQVDGWPRTIVGI